MEDELTWMKLKQALIWAINGNPFEELMMHLQLDDNADVVYITNFNHVSLGEAILGYFIGGLRLEI
jgi:hypothetical protein